MFHLLRGHIHGLLGRHGLARLGVLRLLGEGLVLLLLLRWWLLLLGCLAVGSGPLRLSLLVWRRRERPRLREGHRLRMGYLLLLLRDARIMACHRIILPHQKVSTGSILADTARLAHRTATNLLQGGVVTPLASIRQQEVKNMFAAQRQEACRAHLVTWQVWPEMRRAA